MTRMMTVFCGRKWTVSHEPYWIINRVDDWWTTPICSPNTAKFVIVQRSKFFLWMKHKTFLAYNGEWWKSLRLMPGVWLSLGMTTRPFIVGPEQTFRTSWGCLVVSGYWIGAIVYPWKSRN